MYCKADVFPREKTSKVHRLINYPKFGSLIGQIDVSYFCLYMDENDRIYYQKRELSQNVIKTFDPHGREARKFRQFDPKTINFAKIYNRYRLPPIDSNRTNADTRTGFKMGSDYLVKAYFTFGQRIVQPGQVHVIQTLAVPILFYLRPRKCGDFVANGHFPTRTLYKYDRRILLPDSRYRIPPDSVYVLFCVQKTFFRLDLADEADELSFGCRDPVMERIVKLQDPYEKPIKTPYIEDQQQEKMAATYLGFSFPSSPCSKTREEAEGSPFPAATVASLFDLLNPSPCQQPPDIERQFDVEQPPDIELRPDTEQRHPPEIEQQQVSVIQQQQATVIEQQQASTVEQQQQQPTTYIFIQNSLPPVRETSVVHMAPEEFPSIYRSLTIKEMKDPREKFVVDENWNPLPINLSTTEKTIDFNEEMEREELQNNYEYSNEFEMTANFPIAEDASAPDESEWDAEALIEAAIAVEERRRLNSVSLMDDE